jgi:exodeoxyribonuclease V alpha subunit
LITGQPLSSSLSDSGTPLAGGFAEFIGRLSEKLGASHEAAAVAKEAARECIMALSDGHVCADVKILAGKIGKSREEIKTLLAESGVISSVSEDRRLPLVLDEKGRIYLYRYFDHERKLADIIVAKVKDDSFMPLSRTVRDFLTGRFAANEIRLSGRTDWQKIAVALAITSPITIISGGPGTGKTTIVTTLIATLSLNEPPPRIALVAPTGKAAARMEDAIRKQVDTLEPEIRERLPKRASTIHMLLGARPESSEFRHNIDNPVPYDYVVVDEASMIDLSLASRLFSALPAKGKIVLLGDKDQLAAVEAGAVFAELAAYSSLSDASADGTRSAADELFDTGHHAGPGENGLSDYVVWLKENYRFDSDSAIGKLASLVVNSNVEELAGWLGRDDQEEIKWKSVGDGLPNKIAEEIAGGFNPYIDAVKQGEPAKVLHAYEKFCILCAVRHGKRGVAGINEIMTQRLRYMLAGEITGESYWYHGRPIMVTQNDYGLGVFNGDIGVALKGKDGNISVWFTTREGGVRAVSPLFLPAHQTAFAITVHKAQGSEFENVALVLPDHDSPVLTRELVYTAVTRARQSLSIYGNMAILQTAVCRPTLRRGGLSERILGSIIIP